MSVVKAELGGRMIDLVKRDDGVWATSSAVAGWLGYTDRRQVLQLVRRNPSLGTGSRSVVAATTDRLGDRVHTVFSWQVLPRLAGAASTKFARAIRARLLEEAKANLAAGRPLFSGPVLISLAQDALVECQARIEEIEGHAKGDVAAAFEDVKAGLTEQAELLEVLRTGRIKPGFSLPVFAPSPPDAEDTKPSERNTTHAFARLMKAVDRRRAAQRAPAKEAAPW